MNQQFGNHRSPLRERRDVSNLDAGRIAALTRRATLLAVACGLLAMASARALEITLPPETARLAESSLPGYALANTFCYTCHSADYVKMQPTSSRTYWQATITKMQKVFGAPIPDDAIPPIVDYLVKTYGSERAATAAPTSRGDMTPAKATGTAPKR